MRAALVVLAAAAAGCGATRPLHINRDVHSVAVLLPYVGADCFFEEAAAKVWPYVEHEAATRGWRLVPRATVEAFYASKRFSTGAEIEQFTAQELAQEFKCDAVLYSSVDNWGAKNLLVYTELKVEVSAVLRDGRDGQQLWASEGADSSRAVATDWKEAAKQTIQSRLASLEPYAERATRKCFAGLPLPGFEPKTEPK